MEERSIMQQLARLLTTRKIIALTMTFVACYLWIAGMIELKDAFLIVIGYFFGNKTALDKPGEAS